MGAISDLIASLFPALASLGALALPLILMGVLFIVLIAGILIRIFVINKIKKTAKNKIKGAIKNAKNKKAAKAEAAEAEATETATEEKAE